MKAMAKRKKKHGIVSVKISVMAHGSWRNGGGISALYQRHGEITA